MLVFHISIPGCAAVVALAPRVANFIFAMRITYRLTTAGVRVKLFFMIRLCPSFLKIQTQPARPRKG